VDHPELRKDSEDVDAARKAVSGKSLPPISVFYLALQRLLSKILGIEKGHSHTLEMPFIQDRMPLSPEYKFVVNKTPPKIWPNSA